MTATLEQAAHDLRGVTWGDGPVHPVHASGVFVGWVTERDTGWEFEHRDGHQSEPVWKSRTGATMALLRYASFLEVVA